MLHQSVTPKRWEYRLCADSASSLDGILDAEQRTAIAQWAPCSQFPTEIHLELMRAGIVPHPYKAANEHLVQWVGKQSWEFRAKIDIQRGMLERRMAELEFEGLDTFVTVSLNGKEILEGDNHFLPYKVRDVPHSRFGKAQTCSNFGCYR
jgi:beta-mannosidase